MTDIYTDLMDDEKRVQYTVDRQLHPDEAIRAKQLENLEHLVLHNGFKPEEVEPEMGGFLKFKPIASVESNFYDEATGTLHVINTKGDIRYDRIRHHFGILGRATEQKLNWDIKHFGGEQKFASARFRDLAFELVNEAYDRLDVEEFTHDGVLNVIFGPFDNFPLDEGIEVIDEIKNDFLNYRLLDMGGYFAVNFDYVFADQAKNVIEQFCLATNNEVLGAWVNIFHYGKVGVLDSKANVGDVFVPTGFMDEKLLKDNLQTIYPINNQLLINPKATEMLEKYVGSFHEGSTLNTASILRQKRVVLEEARDLGATTIDMEWGPMASYHNHYDGVDAVRYFFAGVGSDKPLEGQTLAETKFEKRQLNNIARAFTDMIRNYF
jgi:hypothetical protein